MEFWHDEVHFWGNRTPFVVGSVRAWVVSLINALPCLPDGILKRFHLQCMIFPYTCRMSLVAISPGTFPHMKLATWAGVYSGSG